MRKPRICCIHNFLRLDTHGGDCRVKWRLHKPVSALNINKEVQIVLIFDKNYAFTQFLQERQRRVILGFHSREKAEIKMDTF